MTLILQMIKKTIKSFGFALKGILYTIKTQSNFRFHLVATVVVVFCGFYFEIRTIEWLFLLLCIGLVLFAELLNTAIESAIDLCSPETHPLAKIAKDTAAASVLVLAIMAVFVGLIIFIPYFVS
jgi:diacylglycerol kinase